MVFKAETLQYRVTLSSALQSLHIKATGVPGQSTQSLHDSANLIVFQSGKPGMSHSRDWAHYKNHQSRGKRVTAWHCPRLESDGLSWGTLGHLQSPIKDKSDPPGARAGGIINFAHCSPLIDRHMQLLDEEKLQNIYY